MKISDGFDARRLRPKAHRDWGSRLVLIFAVLMILCGVLLLLAGAASLMAIHREPWASLMPAPQGLRWCWCSACW
jgi:hypothetical protein